MITLGSYSYNNVSFRASRKRENHMKSGLVCYTGYVGRWLTPHSVFSDFWPYLRMK